MRREAKIEWVCDRCGLADEVSVIKPGPDGWRVLMDPQLSRRGDISGLPWHDICDECNRAFEQWWKAHRG